MKSLKKLWLCSKGKVAPEKTECDSDASFRDIKTCFAILQATGIWQNSRKSWKYVLYGWFIQLFYILGFVICQTVYTLNTMKSGDRVESVGILLTNLSAVTKQVNFMMQIKKIEKLHIDTCRLSSEAKKMKTEIDSTNSSKMASSNLSYQIFRCYLILGFSSAFLFVMGSLVTGQLPIWLPFDAPKESVRFKIVVIHLFINVLIILPIDICLKFLPILFMSKAIDCLEMLGETLMKIDEKSKPGPSQVLRRCIKQHNGLIEYVKGIEQTFGLTMFITSASTMLIMSFYSIDMAKATVSKIIVF